MHTWAPAQLADRPAPVGVPTREQRRVFALDGKTVRGAHIPTSTAATSSAATSSSGAATSTEATSTEAGTGGYRQPHLVSVLDQTSGAVLGQVQVEAKSSEVDAFSLLLDELDLTDVLITADAAHTNRHHADYLHERGGHYLHRVRDVTFDEDRSQVRTSNGPQVMAALRNFVITALRLAGYTDIAAGLRRHAGEPHRPLNTYKIT